MMSVMSRVGLAALALATLVSCGSGGGPLASSDETARRDASEALDLVDELRADLDDRLAEMTGELEAATTDGDRFRSRLSTRLDRLATRLDRALGRLSRRLEALDGASAAADSALAEARSVARELAVLDKRLDYHLRNH